MPVTVSRCVDPTQKRNVDTLCACSVMNVCKVFIASADGFMIPAMRLRAATHWWVVHAAAWLITTERFNSPPFFHIPLFADWAPEMLVKVDGRRQTYSFPVDWWSFGCLLYEFLSGRCPFRTEAARALDPDKHKVRAYALRPVRMYMVSSYGQHAAPRTPSALHSSVFACRVWTKPHCTWMCHLTTGTSALQRAPCCKVC